MRTDILHSDSDSESSASVLLLTPRIERVSSFVLSVLAMSPTSKSLLDNLKLRDFEVNVAIATGDVTVDGEQFSAGLTLTGNGNAG
jgi:hypothetical protein